MRKYVHTQDAIGFEGKDHAWIRFDRDKRSGGVQIDTSMDITLSDDQFWEVVEWVRGKKPPKPIKPKANKKKARRKSV